MNQSILKQPWTKVWTTEYSMITVWLFGRGFTDYCQQELGYTFGNFIAVIEGNMATGFRSDLQVKRFAAEATKHIVEDKKYLGGIIQKMYQYKKELERLFALSEIEALQPEKFKKFLRLWSLFLPYFIIPLRASDGILESKLPQGEKDKLFNQCKEARLATEHFYKAMEEFLQKLFKYSALRTGNDQKLFRVLTPDEFLNYLVSGAMPALEVLEKRYAYSVMVASAEKNELFIGDEAHTIIDKISKVDATSIKEFRGMVANRGIARGIVKIISSVDDMGKFVGGEILVSPMTRPEFLPVMTNSAAYVTDAGGMLCHAAIVARELNKPCIISTKFATQVLKDGDMVEVNADKGIVVILQ